jgi:uncharacterized protein
MAQTWDNLLFAHWSLPPDHLRRLLPSGVELDTFDGQAWLGVVPFCMSGVRPRMVPALPLLSAFAELNVRTYVTAQGKPGVWFFSLDAASRLAVEGARHLYHLPYFNAAMNVEIDGESVNYSSVRKDSRTAPGEFRGSYRPISEVYTSTPGTLDSWLTERYCLYAARSDGVLYRGEIHHPPWPLQRAEAEFQVNTVAAAHGIRLPNTAPLLHYARRLDVLIWNITRVQTISQTSTR